MKDSSGPGYRNAPSQSQGIRQFDSGGDPLQMILHLDATFDQLGIKFPSAIATRINPRVQSKSTGWSADWDRESFGPWKRIYMVPDAKVIVTLPTTNDQVVLHKFDAEAALEQSGQNYLLVTSRPPVATKTGTTFTYPIKVKLKQGGITYKLDSDRRGMTVSAEGVRETPLSSPNSPTPCESYVKNRTSRMAAIVRL